MAAASDPEDDAELGDLDNEEDVTEQMNGTDNEGDVGHENENSSIYENPSECETPQDNVTAIEAKPNRQMENFDGTTLAEIHAVPKTAESDCCGEGVIVATNDSNGEFDEDCVNGEIQLTQQEQSAAMDGILQPTKDNSTDVEIHAENSNSDGEDNIWVGGDTAGENQEQGFFEDDENNEDSSGGDKSNDEKDSGDQKDDEEDDEYNAEDEEKDEEEDEEEEDDEEEDEDAQDEEEEDEEEEDEEEDEGEEDEDDEEEGVDDEENNNNELYTNDLKIDFPVHCRYFLV